MTTGPADPSRGNYYQGVVQISTTDSYQGVREDDEWVRASRDSLLSVAAACDMTTAGSGVMGVGSTPG